MLASSMFVVITQNVFVYFEMGQNILDYGNFSLHLLVLWCSCTGIIQLLQVAYRIRPN